MFRNAIEVKQNIKLAWNAMALKQYSCVVTYLYDLELTNHGMLTPSVDISSIILVIFVEYINLENFVLEKLF